MKHKLTMLALLCALTAQPTLIQAADLNGKTQSASNDQTENSQKSDWSGIFTGISADYAWGKDTYAGQQDVINRLNGGVFGGFNLTKGQIIYGGEFDLGNSHDDMRQNNGIHGAARARVGKAIGRSMIYGAGGIAIAKVRADSADENQTLIGWTVGAGAETKITRNTFARIEFRHNDFGNQTIGTEAQIKRSESELRFGLGVKF